MVNYCKCFVIVIVEYIVVYWCCVVGVKVVVGGCYVWCVYGDVYGVGFSYVQRIGDVDGE